MQRLTATTARALRLRLAADQGNKCALCGGPLGLKTKLPVLDHAHATGEVRGVLHRGCNAMLGHIENGLARYGLTNMADLSRFLDRVIPYKFEAGHGVLYPTHRTAEEKKVLAATRRKKKAAAKKLESA